MAHGNKMKLSKIASRQTMVYRSKHTKSTKDIQTDSIKSNSGTDINEILKPRLKQLKSSYNMNDRMESIKSSFGSKPPEIDNKLNSDLSNQLDSEENKSLPETEALIMDNKKSSQKTESN